VPSSRGIATARTLVLFAIVALAMALRFVGIDRELPHRIEPDSSLVFQLQRLKGDPAGLTRDHLTGPYPSLPIRLFSLLPYPEIPARVSGPGDEEAHLAAATHPYLLIRVGVGVFSVLGVAASLLLARRFLSPGAAVLVPCLLATSLLSILFAGQARPHGIQATLALAAVLLALRVRERASLGRVLLAAAAAACAGATLQNGIFTLPPLATAILLQETGPGERARPLRRIAQAGLACLVAGAAALAFFPGLPYVDATGVHLGSSEVGAHTIRPSLANLGGIPRLGRMLWEFDPLLAVLAPVGAVLGLARLATGAPIPRERKLDLGILLAYVVPYVGALALDPNVQERFLLPLLPYFACLAAAGIAWILARIRGSAPLVYPRQLAAVVLGTALLAFPLYVAVRYARVAASPDTLEIATAWIREHVDPKDVILSTPGMVLPVLIETGALAEDLKDPSSAASPWLVYQGLIPPPPAGESGDRRFKIRVIPISSWQGRRDFDFERSQALIRDTKAAWVAIEDSKRMHEYFPIAEFERAAIAMGELAYRSSSRLPGPTDGGIFEYSGTRQLAFRLLREEAFGPGVRIYRIRR